MFHRVHSIKKKVCETSKFAVVLPVIKSHSDHAALPCQGGRDAESNGQRWKIQVSVKGGLTFALYIHHIYICIYIYTYAYT